MTTFSFLAHHGKGFFREHGKLISFILKVLISFFSFWYLYAHVWKSGTLKELTDSFSNFGSEELPILRIVIIFLLIFVNWGIEAFKFKLLVAKYNPVTFLNSYKAILSGNAISLWMPARTGDYIGRIIFLRRGSRLKGVLSIIIGSASQFLISVVFGVIGLFAYGKHMLPFLQSSGFVQYIVVPISVLINILIYFNISKIAQVLPKSKFFKPVRRFLLVYRLYSKYDLFKILLLSLMRYAIFNFQMLLLLHLFGVVLPVSDTLLSLFLIYFVQAIIPNNVFTEFASRGAVFLYFFNELTTNNGGVLSATYSLWLLNIILPAMAGLLIILFKRENSKVRQI